MRQTSIFAYRSLSKNQISKRQQDVLRALQSIEPATNRQVSEHSHIPINVVTPRVGELVKKGVIVEAYVAFDVNGRRATFWKTKEAV